MAATTDPEDGRVDRLDSLYPRRPKQADDDPNYNPYLALAGIFENDPFIDDLDAYVEAERQRQRDEAARLADLEDAQAAAKKEGHDMTATNKSTNMSPEGLDGSRTHVAIQQEILTPLNKYMAFAGMFEDSPFAGEVDAYIQAERQRQRDEAAAEADREDAAKVAAKAD